MTAKRKRPATRPTDVIILRVTPDQKRRYRAKAERLGLDLSNWIRMIAEQAP